MMMGEDLPPMSLSGGSCEGFNNNNNNNDDDDDGDFHRHFATSTSRNSSTSTISQNSPISYISNNSVNNINANGVLLLAPQLSNSGIPAFPWRLHDMLNTLSDSVDKKYDHIVSWQMSGIGFKVHDTKLFVQEIMTYYFNQTHYKSFQRQLNIYGFQRITHGSNKGCYTHDLFIRGKPELCRFMVRTKVKNNNNSSNNNNNNSNITSSNIKTNFVGVGGKAGVGGGGIGGGTSRLSVQNRSCPDTLADLQRVMARQTAAAAVEPMSTMVHQQQQQQQQQRKQHSLSWGSIFDVPQRHHHHHQDQDPQEPVQPMNTIVHQQHQRKHSMSWGSIFDMPQHHHHHQDQDLQEPLLQDLDGIPNEQWNTNIPTTTSTATAVSSLLENSNNRVEFHRNGLLHLQNKDFESEGRGGGGMMMMMSNYQPHRSFHTTTPASIFEFNSRRTKTLGQQQGTMISPRTINHHHDNDDIPNGLDELVNDCLDDFDEEDDDYNEDNPFTFTSTTSTNTTSNNNNNNNNNY